MTFTITEQQLVGYVIGYIAIHFCMLYLAFQWWSKVGKDTHTKETITIRERPVVPAETYVTQPECPDYTAIARRISKTFTGASELVKHRDAIAEVLVNLGHTAKDAAAKANKVYMDYDKIEDAVAAVYKKQV